MGNVVGWVDHAPAMGALETALVVRGSVHRYLNLHKIILSLAYFSSTLKVYLTGLHEKELNSGIVLHRIIENGKLREEPGRWFPNYVEKEKIQIKQVFPLKLIPWKIIQVNTIDT